MKLYKTTVKLISITFILIAISIIAVYSMFVIKEYYHDKAYIEYWDKHQNQIENVKHGKLFNFKILNKTIKDHDLILFGEMHGTEQSQIIDVQLIKYLNEKIGMKYHLAELDYSQAYFINQYLANGNDSLIQHTLKNWGVVMGRNAKSYHDKWRKIYAYNQKLPLDKRIKVIGIEPLYNYDLASLQIKQILRNPSISVPSEKSELKQWAKNKMPEIIKAYTPKLNNQNLFDLNLLRQQLCSDFEERGKHQYDNFKTIYKQLNLKHQKFYGYFGFGHVLQKKEGSFAHRINSSNELPFQNKTFSIITQIIDSHVGLNSSALPEFIRDKGPCTKIEYTFDAPFINYSSGINALKEFSTKNSNTLFVINDNNSPYSKKLSLIETKGIIANILDENLKIKGPNIVLTDYCQAIVLIRNSDWANTLD